MFSFWPGTHQSIWFFAESCVCAEVGLLGLVGAEFCGFGLSGFAVTDFDNGARNFPPAWRQSSCLVGRFCCTYCNAPARVSGAVSWRPHFWISRANEDKYWRATCSFLCLRAVIFLSMDCSLACAFTGKVPYIPSSRLPDYCCRFNMMEVRVKRYVLLGKIF